MAQRNLSIGSAGLTIIWKSKMNGIYTIKYLPDNPAQYFPGPGSLPWKRTSFTKYYSKKKKKKKKKKWQKSK